MKTQKTIEQNSNPASKGVRSMLSLAFFAILGIADRLIMSARLVFGKRGVRYYLWQSPKQEKEARELLSLLGCPPPSLSEQGRKLY